MSFNLRDELASRIFVDRLAHDGPTDAPDATGLAKSCLALAQDFCEAVCRERGHIYGLREWLPGTSPSQPGRNSGAPLGIYECGRCGHQKQDNKA